MTYDEEEGLRTHRRSVASEETRASSPPDPSSGWVGAVATIGKMASVPFLLQHVANVGQPSVAPDPNRAAAARDPAYLAKIRFQN